MDEKFGGFGSPVASRGPTSGKSTPVHRPAGDDSPLLFRRTTSLDRMPSADGNKRFDAWVMSTSPYTARKTPPTASMLSDAHEDENTPPVRHVQADNILLGNSQHFQQWLKATSSAKWTPKRCPSSATPPAAPARTPAGMPMSIMRNIQSSVVSPAAAEVRSRPLFDLQQQQHDSDSDDGDEAAIMVGTPQLAAATACRQAASMWQGSFQSAKIGSSTPPRAPAPTPVASSPAAAAVAANSLRQQLMLQPLPEPADSLATPMSQLSLSRAPDIGFSSSISQRLQLARRDWLAASPRQQQQEAASPAEQVIGLMLDGAAHSSSTTWANRTSRLAHGIAAAGAGVADAHIAVDGSRGPPLSPQQQVIQLMLQHESDGAMQLQTHGNTIQAAASKAADGLHYASAATTADGFDGQASSDSYGDSGSESSDDIDASELQQLCGGAAAGTPLSDIISMLLTPELKAAHGGFTPSHALGQDIEQSLDAVGPRVLFASD